MNFNPVQLRPRNDDEITSVTENVNSFNFTNDFATTTTTEQQNAALEALRAGPYWYRYSPELNIPEYWQKFSPRSDGEHEILGWIILLLAFMSFCGNGCVMYVFTRTKSLRTPSNALIVNLALSDFLMMLTQCPIYVTNSFHHRWALPAYLCPFMAFTGGVFGIASIMSMTVVAIDRYLVICRPFLMLRSQMSRDRAQWAIGFVWLYSLAWSLPPLFGYSRYVPEGFMTTCSFDYLDDSFRSRAFIFAMAIGAYFVPLTAVVLCYVFIILEVRRSERKFSRKSRDLQRTPSSGGSSSSDAGSMQKERAKQKKETQIAKVIFVVIMCWVTSWTPYLVVSFMGIFFWREALTPWTSQAPALFAKCGSVYNPLVYAISHPKYREAVRKHFPFLVCFPTKGEQATDAADRSESDKGVSTQARLVATTTNNPTSTTNYRSVAVSVPPSDVAAARLAVGQGGNYTSGGTVSDYETGARTEYEEVELRDSRYSKQPTSVDVASLDNGGSAGEQQFTVARMTKTSSTRAKKKDSRASGREVEVEQI